MLNDSFSNNRDGIVLFSMAHSKQKGIRSWLSCKLRDLKIYLFGFKNTETIEIEIK